ncbi:MAG: phosphoribosylamine--glycine ligase [Chitinophagales bacterium]|nr:phosphoribosylamine--glycine ligase [Chitinophagales bacterium]
MNILLLGSGGREHAFAWKLAQSRICTQLFIAPGNSGTATCGTNVSLDPLDFPAVAAFVRTAEIGMVVVGPEEPLVRGIWDFFQADPELAQIPFIGPSQAGAVLEGSKAWAKAFMQRHKIPTAAYRKFDGTQLAEAKAYLATHALPIVLKADGLAAGKGVIICESHAQAQTELEEMLGGKFGTAGATVVVEQFLSGIEFSVFALTDGKNYKILPEAKDYKRIGEGDTGLNTGGMGAVSPVPFATESVWEKVESRIIKPSIKGLRKEKIPYCGFVFFGLIMVDEDPYVIEYNCRMGDPETEVVLPRLKNDLGALLLSCARGQLARTRIRTDKRAATTIFLVSGGYPGDYAKGKLISGLDKVKGSLVFHAGAKNDDQGQTLTSGGRVLAVTSFGKTFPDALKRSRNNAKKIQYEGKYFRKDIGKDLERYL